MVRSDPLVHRLATDHATALRAMVDQRRALEHLSAADMIPAEHRFCIGEAGWLDLPGDRPWRAADADAALPQ